MCHTRDQRARRQLANRKAFEGGLIPMQNWYAPSLTSNKEAGLGDWSIEDIADLLHTGVSKRGAVYGPMAEVIYNSLQYLTDADVRAMAVYLKSLGRGHARPAPRPPIPPLESSLLMRLGQTVYDAHCASCHGAEGRGMPPALSAARRQPVDPDGLGGQPDPHGAERRLSAGTAGNPMPYGMPPFAQSLSDDEVAAVVTYIRVAWGNRGSAGVGARRPTSCARAPLD